MPNSVAAVNRTGWGESRLSALAGAGLKAAGLATTSCDWRVSQPGAVAQNFADEELRGRLVEEWA